MEEHLYYILRDNTLLAERQIKHLTFPFAFATRISNQNQIVNNHLYRKILTRFDQTRHWQATHHPLVGKSN